MEEQLPALAEEYPGCQSLNDFGTRRKEIHLNGLRPNSWLQR